MTLLYASSTLFIVLVKELVILNILFTGLVVF